MKAGPRVVGVSFVREMWEPEGLPQPLQRGRVIANDQVYMDYANVGSVQIGGPYQALRPARERHAEPPRDFRLPARSAVAEERACATTILSRMARLAYRRPVTKRDVQTLLEFFDTAGATAGASMPAFSSRWSACWSIRISCCASIAIRAARGARRPIG